MKEGENVLVEEYLVTLCAEHEALCEETHLRAEMGGLLLYVRRITFTK